MSRWMTDEEMYSYVVGEGDGDFPYRDANQSLPSSAPPAPPPLPSAKVRQVSAQRANSRRIEAEVGIACRPLPEIKNDMLDANEPCACDAD
jgi:hypothetical protein